MIVSPLVPQEAVLENFSTPNLFTKAADPRVRPPTPPPTFDQATTKGPGPAASSRAVTSRATSRSPSNIDNVADAWDLDFQNEYRDNANKSRMPSDGLTPVRQQPGPTTQMVVLQGNRNVTGMVIGKDNKRDWSQKLLEFHGHDADCPKCFLAQACPCVVYGQNKLRYEHLGSKGTPSPKKGSMCNPDCALHGFMTISCCFGWALQISSRAAVRQRYSIRGSTLKDCLSAGFCSSCSLAQESQEIRLEEDSFPEGVGGSTGQWALQPFSVDSAVNL